MANKAKIEELEEEIRLLIIEYQKDLITTTSQKHINLICGGLNILRHLQSFVYDKKSAASGEP